MAEQLRTMISEEEIMARIREIADQINQEYAGEEVHLVCVLRGGSFFMCSLAKRITLPVTLDFISCSSYGNDTKSSGVVRIVKDLSDSIVGKNVIVIEDVVDTGRTLSYLMKMLSERQPKSLKLCSLLDKPSRRVVEIEADYVGFTIPDKFVVGYGLDYAQKYRNLPYIAEVVFEEEK
ncbi:MAG: hypoxanthine phosphoribosyltransferase [Lachnospiraceae bacterium]|nr:hypoxanthine phosphoribosyltransferase [Lachnospiraceae bacterium]